MWCMSNLSVEKKNEVCNSALFFHGKEEEEEISSTVNERK
jgi:hypothetical protein